MQKILSYSSGYLAALGWQGYIAAASYMTGQQIFIAASVYNPEFVPERWQSCLFVSAKSIFYEMLVELPLTSALIRPLPSHSSLLASTHSWPSDFLCSKESFCLLTCSGSSV